MIEKAVSSGFSFLRICRFISRFAVDLTIAQRTKNAGLCELFGDFIQENAQQVVNLNSIPLFTNLLALEQDLNYRNNKDIFLAGLIGAFEC